MKSQITASLLIKGAVAGSASTYIMSKFQTGLRHLENWSRKDGRIPIQKQEGRHMGTDGSATVKLANRVSKKVLHREVPKQRQKLASGFFHYGFGASMGALYAFISSKRNNNRAFSGLGFGVLVWVAGDNVAAPLMKLSRGPFKEKGSVQARSLGAHLVFGVCLKYLYKGLNPR